MSSSRWVCIVVLFLFVQSLTIASAQRATQLPGYQPYNNGLPGTVNLIGAVSGTDDKSPMSVAVDGMGYFNKLLGLTPTETILRNLDLYKMALKRLPLAVIYVGAQARIGSRDRVFTQDFLYSDGLSGIDVSEQSIYAHEAGLAFGIKRELTGERQKYAVAAFKVREILNRTPMKKLLPFHSANGLQPAAPLVALQTTQKILMSIDNFKKPEHPTDPTIIKDFSDLRDLLRLSLNPYTNEIQELIKTAIEYYNKIQRNVRISSFIGYRAFPSAELWNGGLSISQLLTDQCRKHRPQSAIDGVYGLLSIQAASGQFTSQYISHRLFALRTGLAIYWQDKIPFINLDLDPEYAFIQRWHVQTGLELRLASGVDPNPSYNLFVRYRELKGDYEATVSIGSDAFKQGYLNLSIGRSFRSF